jgi:hypothetical protein
MTDILYRWWLSTSVPFMSLYEQSRIYTVDLPSLDHARIWTTEALADMKRFGPINSERKIILWTATAFIISKWPKDKAATDAAEVRDLLYKRTRTAEGLSVVTKFLILVMIILFITSAIRDGPKKQDHRMKPWYK